MINIFDIKLFSNPFNRLFVGGNFLGDREAGLSPDYKLHITGVSMGISSNSKS